MPNIKISIDEDLLQEGEKYAQQHQISLDNLIGILLKKAVTASETWWLEECFQLMDSANADSRGEKWNRGDLYLG